MAKGKTYETLKGIRCISGLKPIINYVREEDTREPIGVVIAIGKNQIGWSKKKGTGRWNSSAGVISAYVNAISNSSNCTGGDIPETNRKFKLIKEAFNRMAERSEIYYTEDHPHNRRTVN